MLKTHNRRGILFTGVGTYFIIVMVMAAQMIYTYEIAIWGSEMSKIEIDKCINVREVIREAIVQQIVFNGKQGFDELRGGPENFSRGHQESTDESKLRKIIGENLKMLENGIEWLYNHNKDVMVLIYGIDDGAAWSGRYQVVNAENIGADGKGSVYVGFFGGDAYTFYVAPYREKIESWGSWTYLQYQASEGGGDGGKNISRMLSIDFVRAVGLVVYWSNATSGTGERPIDTYMGKFTTSA